jgi:hypothetical protein
MKVDFLVGVHWRQTLLRRAIMPCKEQVVTGSYTWNLIFGASLLVFLSAFGVGYSGQFVHRFKNVTFEQNVRKPESSDHFETPASTQTPTAWMGHLQITINQIILLIINCYHLLPPLPHWTIHPPSSNHPPHHPVPPQPFPPGGFFHNGQFLPTSQCGHLPST